MVLLQTRTDIDYLPAVDGGGRASITAPDELAAYRAALEAHPLVEQALAEGLWPALRGLVRFTRYLAGYAVMSAGEQADRIGIVLAGRCRVWRPATPAETVAWIEPGALLGEMSVVARAPRAATVGALRDTVLAELYVADLERLDDLRPVMMLHRWIAEVVARRALGLGGARPVGMNLVVAGSTHAMGFAERLVEAGRAAGERWALRGQGDWSDTPTVQQMEAVERGHDYVVYVADGRDRVWLRQVMRQADRVMVVADAADDPRPTTIDREAGAARAPYVLVLLQPADIEYASNTARWLRGREPAMHLHVRAGNRADVARCMRLVTGRGRGVAFAGASSRGLGYCGMIQALEELAVAPDIVSGNSSGALGAAFMAIELDSARVQSASLAAYAALRPTPTALTLPIVSLMTGGRFTRFLQQTFGDVHLEDLLVPCVLTAVDLGTLSMVDMRTGPLWRAVRASMSLPAYYPPVVADHRVLVDGGVLQNIPVGPLDGCCHKGFVLIGDLSQDAVGFTDVARYGAVLSGWRLLWRRLWPFGRRKSYPTMPEVLFRTACLASLRNQEALLRQPHPSWLHLRPETPPIGLFDAEALIPRLIEDTRRHTLDMLTGSDRPAVRAALADASVPAVGRALPAHSPMPLEAP